MADNEVRPENVRVEFSLEVTINTGNFQNVRPGYRLSADVPEGAHPNSVRDKLRATVETWISEDIEEYREELNS
jgi:hypothetical protein